MTTQQQAVVDDVVNELRPAVAGIEARLATTQNHYGDYMQVLSRYPTGQRTTFAILLIKAGANVEGVKWALRLTGGQ